MATQDVVSISEITLPSGLWMCAVGRFPLVELRHPHLHNLWDVGARLLLALPCRQPSVPYLLSRHVDDITILHV